MTEQLHFSPDQNKQGPVHEIPTPPLKVSRGMGGAALGNLMPHPLPSEALSVLGTLLDNANPEIAAARDQLEEMSPEEREALVRDTASRVISGNPEQFPHNDSVTDEAYLEGVMNGSKLNLLARVRKNVKAELEAARTAGDTEAVARLLLERKAVQDRWETLYNEQQANR